MNEIEIIQPDDFHVHFRDDCLLKGVLSFTASIFGRAKVMPNIVPAVTDVSGAKSYEGRIMAEFSNQKIPNPGFMPLMTIQITDKTTLEVITEAFRGGVLYGKIYPHGVTTNSHNGVSDFIHLYPVFEVMQDHGMILSLHGEKPGVYCQDREKEFLPVLVDIVQNFPKLRIILEHISTKVAVEMVWEMPNTVAATITPQHMRYDLSSVLAWVGPKGSEGLHPHLFCKPLLGRPEDMKAVLEAAVSGNPKFFLGSDTAPHLRHLKESDCGCAGVFSAPALLPVLADTFEQAGRLNCLEEFTSVFGAEFHGLPLNKGEITLIRRPFNVPEEIPCAHLGSIVPMCAGEVLPRSVSL